MKVSDATGNPPRGSFKGITDLRDTALSPFQNPKPPPDLGDICMSVLHMIGGCSPGHPLSAFPVLILYDFSLVHRAMRRFAKAMDKRLLAKGANAYVLSVMRTVDSNPKDTRIGVAGLPVSYSTAPFSCS